MVIARRRAGGQRLFQFLMTSTMLTLREETIQTQWFDSGARDATVVVVAEVRSSSFTRAATSFADVFGGALADLEWALPGAVVVVITVEQTVNHRID